jgi:anti-anti-sigma regulatory factor
MDTMTTLEMMETSAIQKLENLLLVAVPRDLTDSDVLRLRREVLQAVRRYHSRWVLLDFSRVDICDSFFGRFIQSTARMAGLMGADVVVSGLQDAGDDTAQYPRRARPGRCAGAEQRKPTGWPVGRVADR